MEKHVAVKAGQIPVRPVESKCAVKVRLVVRERWRTWTSELRMWGRSGRGPGGYWIREKIGN